MVSAYLPFFGRKMYCPSEAFSWACMRRFLETGLWRAVFLNQGATGGRRLRMDARLPVLRLIRVGNVSAAVSCLSQFDVRVAGSGA